MPACTSRKNNLKPQTPPSLTHIHTLSLSATLPPAPSHLGLYIHVRLCLHQRLHHLTMALLARPVQRRVAILHTRNVLSATAHTHNHHATHSITCTPRLPRLSPTAPPHPTPPPRTHTHHPCTYACLHYQPLNTLPPPAPDIPPPPSIMPLTLSLPPLPHSPITPLPLISR